MSALSPEFRIEVLLVLWLLGAGALVTHVITVWWRFSKLYDVFNQINDLLHKSQGVKLAEEITKLRDEVRSDIAAADRRLRIVEETGSVERSAFLDVNHNLLRAIDGLRTEWSDHRASLAVQVAADVRSSVEAISRSTAREETHKILDARSGAP